MQKNPNWKRKFAELWLNNWLAPPRPTPQELSFTKQYLKQLKQQKPDLQVLILGSTSEWRDLLIDLNISPTIVDFNQENYHILAHAMKHKKSYPKHEKFICADWTTMKLNKKFDLIMSEASLNVVPPKDLNKLLKNISFHLNKESVLLHKTWRRFNNHRPNIAYHLKKYKVKSNINTWLYLTHILINLYIYDFKNDYSPAKYRFALVKKLYQEEKITKAQFTHIANLDTPDTKFRLSMPLVSVLKKKLQPYFKTNQVFITQELYSKYHPIYISKK